MRVAVLYGRQDGAIGRFLHTFDAGLSNSQGSRYRRIMFPQSTPIIAAAIDTRRNPPVQCASNAAGSFLILDGEVFDIPYEESSQNQDADRLLDLYLARGPDAIVRLDFSASIVIWDAKREQLSVYRDRFGLVPSFYTQGSGYLVWASDIATLLRIVDPPDVNLAALDFFLEDGFIPAPWTFAEGIMKLQPAHVLRCRGNRAAETERYWLPNAAPKEKLDRIATVEKLGDLFECALHRRCRPKARLGVLLSGGVDSKLVAAGLRKRLGLPADTFTFHYEAYEGGYNETVEARRVAAYLGSIHHEVPVHPMDIADNIEWLVQSYGEPFTSGLHTAFLRDIANSGVSLLFNGAGGDSWYLGKQNHFGLRFTSLPKVLREVLRLGLPLVRWSKSERAEQLASILAWSPTAYHAHFHHGVTTQDFRSQLYRNSVWMPESNLRRNALFSDAAKDYEGATAHDKLIFLHAQFYLAEHVFYWNHCWSRVHDLASRSPYFDAKLMDFVFSLPRMNLNKNEIRQLAATLIPRDMAYRSKSAQAIPIGHWFRGPLKDFLRDNLSPERVRTSGLFDNSVVQRVIEDHIKGTANGKVLWAMLSILVWQNLVSRRALASEAPTRSASAGERGPEL